MRPDDSQGSEEVVTPPADQPCEYVEIKRQGSRVLVDVLASQRRLADTRGTVEGE